MRFGDRAALWLRRARTTIVTHRRAIIIGTALFLLSAFGFRLLRDSAGYWTIDDAGITYSAAFELADHGSLSPYIEGTPIEGYSNPLLFFIVTVLRLLRVFDPITTHIQLEMIVFAAMIVLVWRLLRRLTGEIAAAIGAVAFALIELLVPSTWIWYGSGLENVWLSAGFVAMIWLCARTGTGVTLRPGWGALVFAVSITRPEAPIYAIAFYAALLLFARPAELPLRAHMRQLSRAIAVTVALYMAFLIWRRVAYHAWLPNTYYAKIGDDLKLAENMGDYVVGQLLGYGRSGMFAMCVLALLLIRKLETLGLCLLAFLITSLVLPIVAGPDWMGEHRFATPFFAVCHLCYAALLAGCIAQVRWQLPPIGTLVATLALPLLLVFGQLSVRNPPIPSKVTIGQVAYFKGALRWEDQMRLGLPYPVVLTPDVGGTLLVGGIQTVDNGALTDFQMARIGRHYGDPEHVDARVLAQYLNQERRPDLVDPNPFWPLGRNLVTGQYLRNGGTNSPRFYARRDLVEVPAVEPEAELVLEAEGVRVYVSRETVRTVAPGGLIRCEVFVSWTTKPDDTVRIRASLGAFDGDEISVGSYVQQPSGVERHAFLLGVPQASGPFAISFELLRGRKQLAVGRSLVIQVSDNPFSIQRAVASLAIGASPVQLARRTAWLREQMIRRLSVHQLHDLEAGLFGADVERKAIAGRYIRLLRWNARLATREALPAPLRRAEDAAIRGMFDTCGSVRRLLCIGRVADQLRRLGYLDVLARVPAIASELRGEPPSTGLARYEALVGITLARPDDLDRQWELLDARRALAKAGPLPGL